MDAEEIIKEKEEVTRQINNKSVSLHGDPLHHKEPGTVRLVFENMNKLAPWRPKGWKLEKARAMMKETSGDFYLGAEVGTNWSKMRKGQDLSTLFRTNTEAKTICGYNKHDNIERGQEGGTAIIALDSAATMVSKSGTDFTGLGRWSWMWIRGKGNHHTRIIAAYQLCRNNSKGVESNYALQRQYFRERGDTRCPRLIFRSQLIKQLEKWKQEGDRIILMMDANEHIYTGHLAKLLRSPTIQMKEMLRTRTGVASPATFFRGTKPIDGA